jgi:hypothetical protein
MGSPRYSSSSLWRHVTTPIVPPCYPVSRGEWRLSFPCVGAFKIVLKLAVVLGIVGAIGVATGVIKVNFRPIERPAPSE